MKFTFFVMLWAFIFTLVCAGVCPPVAADIWTSGKVVYTTDAYGDLDIAVMGPDGVLVEVLTDSFDDEFNPTWSPDGSEVLYVRDNFGGPEVWLMDADGWNQRRIAFGDHPSWAPDGDRFVILEDRDGDPWLEILTLNEDRDDFAEIDNIVTRGNPAYPAWSPDGKYIAYVDRDEDSLYVYDVVRERSTKITRRSTQEDYMSFPTWGPQSNRIVFAASSPVFADGAPGIYWAARDGGDLDILYWLDDYSLFHPTVAPYGGEFIVARHDPGTGERYLYKVTRRTNNWQRLDPDSGTYNDDADWWHPSYFSVEPGASQLTTTWGDLKKKAR